MNNAAAEQHESQLSQRNNLQYGNFYSVHVEIMFRNTVTCRSSKPQAHHIYQSIETLAHSLALRGVLSRHDVTRVAVLEMSRSRNGDKQARISAQLRR